MSRFLLVTLIASALSTFSACEDCLAIKCFEGLNVTIVGLQASEFTITARDLDRNRTAERNCNPSVCGGSVVSFGDFTPESLEITIAFGAATLTRTFDVQYRDNSTGCSDCVLGEVTFVVE